MKPELSLDLKVWLIFSILIITTISHAIWMWPFYWGGLKEFCSWAAFLWNRLGI